MKRSILETADGSKTIYIDEWNESYHSVHGAVQEAIHVFINQGLKCFENSIEQLKILEIGYGTGLNCFLTLLVAEQQKISIDYLAVEKFPILIDEFKGVDYFDLVMEKFPEFLTRKEEFRGYYDQLFLAKWEQWETITPRFRIKKEKKDFFDLAQSTDELVDLVYFDAFGSRVQPELWQEDLLKIVSDCMKPVSVFTTYAAKGTVKRGLTKFGFIVKKKPGPPGKREMMVGYRELKDEQTI